MFFVWPDVIIIIHIEVIVADEQHGPIQEFVVKYFSQEYNENH